MLFGSEGLRGCFCNPDRRLRNINNNYNNNSTCRQRVYGTSTERVYEASSRTREQVSGAEFDGTPKPPMSPEATVARSSDSAGVIGGCVQNCLADSGKQRGSSSEFLDGLAHPVCRVVVKRSARRRTRSRRLSPLFLCEAKDTLLASESFPRLLRPPSAVSGTCLSGRAVDLSLPFVARAALPF